MSHIHHNHNVFSIFALFILLIGTSVRAPPVDSKKDDTTIPPDDVQNNPTYRLEYERYLHEVVQLLESDPDFKKKLESAKPEDIDSGKIAEELIFVNHSIRSKLTEAKRREVERINEIVDQLHDKSEDAVSDRKAHLEHQGHSFDEEDLRKLIFKAKTDMDTIDRLRKDEFKIYEMEKRYRKELELSRLKGEELKKKEAEFDDQKTRHAKHDRVNHPFNEEQLQELWEQVDDLEGKVDPMTLFKLHDVDGNDFWDVQEVEALFQPELDKVYQMNISDDDMNERIEEMNRMREHVFKESDTNGDELISFEEFDKARLETAGRKEKQWETLDQAEPVFSEDDYFKFKKLKHNLAALEPTPATSSIPPSAKPEHRDSEKKKDAPVNAVR